MARRNISPVKIRTVMEPALPLGMDERDLIIKKLKEELIIARSKEKEVVILENYLLELKEKIRVLAEDIRRKENEIKNKTELSQKAINELKREVEIYKGQLKNSSIELGEKEGTLLEMKRHLAKRSTELEKVKKETLHLKDENNRLARENAEYSSRFNEIDAELSRIEATNREYNNRIAEMNARIGEVKAYIGGLKNEAAALKDKLKRHEQENNNISDDLNSKQESIDDLERVFAEQHDEIKGQIDNYIDLEHKNEKLLTEIRHKINLSKAENEKSLELNSALRTPPFNLRESRQGPGHCHEGATSCAGGSEAVRGGQQRVRQVEPAAGAGPGQVRGPPAEPDEVQRADPGRAGEVPARGRADHRGAAPQEGRRPDAHARVPQNHHREDLRLTAPPDAHLFLYSPTH